MAVDDIRHWEEGLVLHRGSQGMKEFTQYSTSLSVELWGTASEYEGVVDGHSGEESPGKLNRVDTLLKSLICFRKISLQNAQKCPIALTFKDIYT